MADDTTNSGLRGEPEKKNLFLVTYGPNHKGLNPIIFYFEPRKPEFELATSNQHDYTQHLTNIAT